MRRPLAPEGKITLFVDGFGVEVDAGYIAETKIEDGDCVSMATLRELGQRHRDETGEQF